MKAVVQDKDSRRTPICQSHSAETRIPKEPYLAPSLPPLAGIWAYVTTSDYLSGQSGGSRRAPLRLMRRALYVRSPWPGRLSWS